jgi:malonate-semialdehyde dehydrogenase (acetylating) / methylmalonate-semialdehyde dehydrogenase
MTLPVMKNFINGEWVDSKTTTFGDVWNPAKGEKIASVPYGVKEDVDMAVQAAKAAFPEWRKTPPLTRARYLFRLKEAFEENFEEIARVLTTEQGKAIDDSRGEVRRMIENVEHATGVTTLMTGYTLEDIAKGIDCYGHRQPLGVFAAIVPFNFPGMVAWWFMPYALVSGNTFIVKPSEQVPMTQAKIFEIIEEVGFPEGVINLVNGAHDVVNGLLDHPDIKGISFVGSTPTAKYIYERCGATGKRVQALGGAKNIVAVMPDANIDDAIPSLITSFYGCTGQRCLAGAILAPVGDAADEVIEKFLAASKEVRVGNGLDETTAMGPLAGAQHKERVLGYIERGIAEGAELIMDGRDISIPDHPNGYYVGPTVFKNVKNDMAIATDEIFGPVVSIVNPKNMDELVELVNSRQYANASCLYTQSGASARDFKYRVNPSMVGINIGVAAPMSFFPFGGYGNSMFGDVKGHGQEIFQFFTDMKVVIERWY